jgi:hypothetical protein
MLIEAEPQAGVNGLTDTIAWVIESQPTTYDGSGFHLVPGG